MAIGLLDLSSFLFTRILLLRLLPEAAQRAPEPRRPAQPRPHTRRSHHIAHAEGRRIGRHQRPAPRGPTRNVRCTQTLHTAKHRRQPQSKLTPDHRGNR